MSDKIRWAVQALAQPVDIQTGLFPDFVNVPDELALTWEEALYELEQRGETLSDGELMAVRSLDEAILAISGESNHYFWTETALRESDQWNEIRVIAAAVAEAMNWPTSSPEKATGIYVGPKGG